MIRFYDKLQEHLAINAPFVPVTVVDAWGSAPQNAGTKRPVSWFDTGPCSWKTCRT